MPDLSNAVHNYEYIKIKLEDKANNEMPLKLLNATITSKDNKIYALFKFKDSDNYTCKGSEEIHLEDIDASINNIMSNISNGDNAIQMLNAALKNEQYEHGEPLNIAYKWGNGKYCSICNWDYGNIKIKLNSIALDKLIEMSIKESSRQEINELASSIAWNDNIVTFIRNFDTFVIHNKLGAVLEEFDVEKILAENMLSTQDVISIIQKNNNKQCVQKFKSIFVVRELGKFIAILNWVVDYSKNTINTSIMNDKVLDVESARYISDHNICSRIEARSSLSQDVIDKIFNYKV